AVVRRALIVLTGQVAQILRDRGPDRIDADAVPAVQGGDAVCLLCREVQAVLLTENLRHWIGEAARAVHQTKELLGHLLPIRAATAIELHRERLPLARRSD